MPVSRKRKPRITHPKLFEPDLGPKFDAVRQKTALTYEQIAIACGVSRQAVSKWARVGVPAERALPVARLLGCPVKAIRPDLYRDTDTRR